MNLDFWSIFVPSSIEVAKFMASSFHLSSGISMKSFFFGAKEEYKVDMVCVSLGSFAFLLFCWLCHAYLCLSVLLISMVCFYCVVV